MCSSSRHTHFFFVLFGISNKILSRCLISFLCCHVFYLIECHSTCLFFFFSFPCVCLGFAIVFLLKQVCERVCLLVRARREGENEKDMICIEGKHFFKTYGE